MGTVLKVSLPGVDVMEATPEQCSIHSDYPTPKIDVTKEHFVNLKINFNKEPPDPGGALTTLTTNIFEKEHGLKYTPQFWVHVEYEQTIGVTTTLTFGPGDAYLGAETAADATFLRVRADDKKYYVDVEKTSGISVNDILHIAGTSLTVRLYIMVDGVLDA